MASVAQSASARPKNGASASLLQRRNIGIMAHIDAGKTTVTERILFLSDKIHKTGEVHDGGATMDYLAEEQKRGITIQSAATSVDWKDYVINIIDTPGHVDFTAEVERSLRVLDGAVAVFDAVSGVEAQSETVWRQANKYKVPRMCFINKMDRVGSDFAKAVLSIRDRLNARPVPIQFPLGAEKEFMGYADLVTGKCYEFDEASGGRDVNEIEVPEQWADDVELARHELLETAAEFNEELLDLFVDDEEVPVKLLMKAIRAGTLGMEITPVLCGSALKDKGVSFLLDAVIDYLPSPLDIEDVEGSHPRDPEEKMTRRPDPSEPMCLMAFKTIAEPTGDLTFVRVYSGILKKGTRVQNPRTGKYERIGRLVRMHASKREAVDEVRAGDIAAVMGLKNTVTGDTLCDDNAPILLNKITFPESVISMSLEPAKGQDRDKLGDIIGRMMREDPTFRAATNEETGELVISGMGELHLEVVVGRIRNDNNCDVTTGKPKVAYKQQLTREKEFQIRYVRQSGGRGQFAVIKVRVGPGEPEDGLYEFHNKIKGGNVPKEYIPSVEAGILAGVKGGGKTGHPFVNVVATLIDGKSHDVDSSEMAFHAAGVQAFREASETNSTLLEPIMKIEVRFPEEFLGSVVGDLNSRRGEVGEVEADEDLRIVRGLVPISEMFAYTSALRGATQGRGSFSMELEEYRPVPANIAKKIFEDEV